MPDDVALDFRRHMDVFLLAYTWLGAEADKLHELRFTAAPKLHWAWHLAYKAFYLNPRRSACFLDEDFVKHCKTLGAKCTASTQLHRVPLSMMTKYRYGVDFELTL